MGRFEATPPEVRRRWARTGTSLPHAVLLEQLAAQVRAELPTVPNPRDPVSAFLFISDRGRLGQLLGIHATRDTRFRPRRNAPLRTAFDVDLRALIVDWLRGEEVGDIGTTYLEAVTDDTYRYEQLSEFIAQVLEHPGADIEKAAVQRSVAGFDGILDPREGHQVVQRETNSGMLADRLPLFRWRRHRVRPRRLGDAYPLADEIGDFARRAVEQCLNAAAHGVTQHHDFPHLERAHGEFDRRTHAVRVVVRPVRRHDIGDVADDEEFAGACIEHHLRIGAAVRTGDDQRTRPLAEATQRLETAALGLPGAGAEAAIAFDQVVHGEPIIFVRFIPTRYNGKQEGCLPS